MQGKWIILDFINPVAEEAVEPVEPVLPVGPAEEAHVATLVREPERERLGVGVIEAGVGIDEGVIDRKDDTARVLNQWKELSTATFFVVVIRVFKVPNGGCDMGVEFVDVGKRDILGPGLCLEC